MGHGAGGQRPAFLGPEFGGIADRVRVRVGRSHPGAVTFGCSVDGGTTDGVEGVIGWGLPDGITIGGGTGSYLWGWAGILQDYAGMGKDFPQGFSF